MKFLFQIVNEYIVQSEEKRPQTDGRTEEWLLLSMFGNL